MIDAECFGKTVKRTRHRGPLQCKGPRQPLEILSWTRELLGSISLHVPVGLFPDAQGPSRGRGGKPTHVK